MRSFRCFSCGEALVKVLHNFQQLYTFPQSLAPKRGFAQILSDHFAHIMYSLFHSSSRKTNLLQNVMHTFPIAYKNYNLIRYI